MTRELSRQCRRRIEQSLTKETFEIYTDPAYQKYVIDVRLAGDCHEAGYRLTIDHRLHALSETSRRQFARFWLVIGPASWFMLGILLGAIKRCAERDSHELVME